MALLRQKNILESKGRTSLTVSKLNNVYEDIKSLLKRIRSFVWVATVFFGGKNKNPQQPGMECFLSNGNPTEAVDVMQYCWTGEWPQSRAPSIKNISLENIGWRKDHTLSFNTSNFKNRIP